MTGLRDIIQSDILQNGPMPLDRYMALCLGHPQFGYYMQGTPFGAEGDFITAPETSQVFGELLGVWGVHMWQTLGCPKPFHLIELGPGRGVLMADMLRATRGQADFMAALQVHLVEMSPALRAQQAARLQSYSVTWHDTFSSIAEAPFILVANEFFDALPIKQYEKRGAAWFERCIGLEGIGLVPSVQPGGVADADGVYELSPQRQALAEEIGQRLCRVAGAALIIDYGHVTAGAGDTLQAIARHDYVAITEAAGQCDLTSHVDFAALEQALERGGATVARTLTQAEFLRAMGAELRFQQLSQRADAETQAILARQQQRLLGDSATELGTDHKKTMGQLFKFMLGLSPMVNIPYPFASA